MVSDDGIKEFLDRLYKLRVPLLKMGVRNMPVMLVDRRLWDRLMSSGDREILFRPEHNKARDHFLVYGFKIRLNEDPHDGF